jgi:hypothetical protein
MSRCCSPTSNASFAPADATRPAGARDEFHLAAAAQNLRKLAKLIRLLTPAPADRTPRGEIVHPPRGAKLRTAGLLQAFFQQKRPCSDLPHGQLMSAPGISAAASHAGHQIETGGEVALPRTGWAQAQQQDLISRAPVVSMFRHDLQRGPAGGAAPISGPGATQLVGLVEPARRTPAGSNSAVTHAAVLRCTPGAMLPTYRGHQPATGTRRRCGTPPAGGC